MSAVRVKDVWMSPETYLEWQQTQEDRHEYLAGEVYCMAGASVEHNRICGNVFAELHGHLKGHRCEAFMNDMKVHIHDQGDDWFYYPDVMVNCDPAGQQKHYCDTPAVIFEVTSPGTEQTDRREKRFAYERLPSLHTYVLVAQDRREVTIYHRADGLWHRSTLAGAADVLEIAELGFRITLDAIYARTGL